MTRAAFVFLHRLRGAEERRHVSPPSPSSPDLSGDDARFVCEHDTRRRACDGQCHTCATLARITSGRSRAWRSMWRAEEFSLLSDAAKWFCAAKFRVGGTFARVFV